MDLLEWSRHFRCFPGQGSSTSPAWSPPPWRRATADRSRSRCSATWCARPTRCHRPRRLPLAGLPRGPARGAAVPTRRPTAVTAPPPAPDPHRPGLPRDRQPRRLDRAGGAAEPSASSAPVSTAPSRCVVAQRRRARRPQRTRGAAGGTRSGVVTPRSTTSPPGPRRCSGPPSTAPAARARRCSRASPPRRACTSSSAPTPGRTTLARDFEPTVATRRVTAGPASTMSGSPSAGAAERGDGVPAHGLRPRTRRAEEFMEPQGRLRSRALRPAAATPAWCSTSRGPSAAAPQGITQVAFALRRRARPVAALRARGVALMAVPDNYYVDLAARFGLRPRAARRAARAPAALRPGRARASCCTSTPTCLAPASTSSCSSAAAGTTATAAPTPTCGWPRQPP